MMRPDRLSSFFGDEPSYKETTENSGEAAKCRLGLGLWFYSKDVKASENDAKDHVGLRASMRSGK